jgi:hypothetical protein
LIYKDPNFDNLVIRDFGLIQLPSVARPGYEYLQTKVDSLLYQEFNTKYPNLLKISLAQVKSILSDSLLRSYFNSLSRSYLTRTGVDKMVVSHLSENLGCRYLLTIYIENYDKEKLGSEASHLLFPFSDEHVLVNSSTIQQRLILTAQIWDGETGEIVWARDSIVSATAHKGNFEYLPSDINKYLELLISGLVNSIQD